MQMESGVDLSVGRRVEVPIAVAAFSDPIFPVPTRLMVERSHKVVRDAAQRPLPLL